MSDLTGRRIALIGGAGFIGHNLALRLNELNAQTFVIDSLAVNNYYSLQAGAHRDPHAPLYLKIIAERLGLLKEGGIPLLERDSRDYHALSQTIRECNPDTIIHLAAVAHAVQSNKDPHTTFDHSLRTLENALDVARSTNLNVKHFVYFSSSMVYGNFSTDIVTEESPCEPLGIYGALKFAGEKIVIAYNQVFDLNYTIVRPSALYGPRCVSRRVVQIFLENALWGREITVSGDGSDRLDFTFISDLVGGVVSVLENEHARNQVFNLTYGESRTIAELAEIVRELFPGVAARYVSKDRLTPARGTLSVDKARQMIGYAPQWPLERGIPEYRDWYRSHWNELTRPGG